MMTTDWRKSSYSNGTGGDCVEACASNEGASVRDTQNREAGHLSVSGAEWTALLGAVASAK